MRRFTIRIESEDLWQKLRKISYENEISLNKCINDILELSIDAVESDRGDEDTKTQE